MASNQTPQNVPPKDPGKAEHSASSTSALTGNRTMMIIVGVVAGLAVLGLVWVCLVFFRMI